MNHRTLIPSPVPPRLSHLPVLLLAAVSMVLLPSAVSADDAADDPLGHLGHRLLLHRADADRDGTVTADEWRAMADAVAQAFADLDRDGDGSIAVDRRRGGMRGNRPPRHRHRIDGPGAPMMRGHRAGLRVGSGLHRAADVAGNGDGTLDRGEWLDFLGGVDTDGDGHLGPEEVHTALREAFPDHPQPTGPSVDDLIARFDEADANDDGELSEDERPRRRWRHRHDS